MDQNQLKQQQQTIETLQLQLNQLTLNQSKHKELADHKLKELLNKIDILEQENQSMMLQVTAYEDEQLFKPLELAQQQQQQDDEVKEEEEEMVLASQKKKKKKKKINNK